MMTDDDRKTLEHLARYYMGSKASEAIRNALKEIANARVAALFPGQELTEARAKIRELERQIIDLKVGTS